MIPQFSRVVAVDDDEDHLQKISWGLGKAGFSAIPFHFDDGKLENAPNKPIPGIRIFFTDIHMVDGAMAQKKTHASNIINCIKKIIAGGPYVLVFWSQYPGESDEIQKIILERALEAGITPPIGFAAIDKNQVFAAALANADDDFDALKLRDLILEIVSQYKTLAVAASWENRVAEGATRTTNRLFDLVKSSENPSADWEKLLAYLATEAVGQENAKTRLITALDAALLPLLEDQLGALGDNTPINEQDAENLSRLVSINDVSCPPSVSKSRLNSSYLIEEVTSSENAKPCSRGMVSQLGGSFINSGPFINAFAYDADTLIRKEFATRDLEPDEKKEVSLHILELGPECDHVQEKIASQRYLLGILVPVHLLYAFVGADKKAKKLPNSFKYRNESVVDIGQIWLNGSNGLNYHLLLSARCFMTLPARAIVHSTPKFRLRRALLEEVAHRYITYTRRPGVMRFKA